jgi:hypothetical protein
MFREEDIATLVPKSSEIRALLQRDSDGDETVPWLRRPAVASAPDTELAALVAVYERRAERLAKDRAHAIAIVAQACESDPPTRAQPKPEPKPRGSTRARVRELCAEHAYTIIFSVLCVWGTLHLILVR